MLELSSRVRQLFDRTARVGGEPEDADLRTQKSVLVTLSLLAVPLGVIWTPLEFLFGDPKSGPITGAIAAMIIANFLIYTRHKNYVVFRSTQLVVFLLFPIALHFSIGGFTKSANLIWCFATPLIALLGSKPKEGTVWFVSFLVIVSICGFVDPLLFPDNSASVATAFFEFSFNIINVSLIIYLMLVYLFRQKLRAFKLLEKEKAETERLLLNVLPKEIAPRLKASGKIIADRFDSATILFADIVNFTPLSAHLSAEEIVELLNKIFTHFDQLVDERGLEKIRTIGDNYMVASGLPTPRKDHAHAATMLALDMTRFVDALPSRNGNDVNIRVGINSGSVVAGVIGKRKFQYDVWGDMVNLASRMESQGESGRIQISTDTYSLIKDDFECERRGSVSIKGKGDMVTWFVVGPKGDGAG